MKKEWDWKNTAFQLKIGVVGAIIILIGDMLMGWGLKDLSKSGIEGQLSQYLSLSDTRMLIAAICGFSGVPLAVIGHYGIYQLMKPSSLKYARMYGLGNLCFLAFGGAGVHVSSVEAAYFYKYMSASGTASAFDLSIRFASYFLVPLYIILLIGWAIMVYAHIRVIVENNSAFPKWFWIFSMPVGSLLFSVVGLLGNYEIVNAILVGAFSLGNIWCLAGHLWFVNKRKEA